MSDLEFIYKVVTIMAAVVIAGCSIGTILNFIDEKRKEKKNARHAKNN